MRSRMERYQDEARSTKEVTRTNKNQDLYHNFYTNNRYADLDDVIEKSAVELSNLDKSYQTREGYHKIKEYESILPQPKLKRELEQLTEHYQEEEKIYDINSVLVEAKKNREVCDELERKRRLKNTQYNILANLDVEELEKYKEEKKRRLVKEQDIDEDELQELIQTITSKTMTRELKTVKDKDLMSELLPSSEEESVVTNTFQVETKKTAPEVTQTTRSNLKNVDESFYTRSMDLSDKDFEMDEEFKEDVKEVKIPLAAKIILFILLIAIVFSVIYFVINRT